MMICQKRSLKTTTPKVLIVRRVIVLNSIVKNLIFNVVSETTLLSTRTLVTSDISTHGKLLKLVANTIRNLSEENVKSTSKPDENQTKGKNSLCRTKSLFGYEMT